MPLLIHSETLKEIVAAAAQHGSRECMGLLLSERGEAAVTGAYLLEAETSCAHAESPPEAIRAAVLEIRGAGRTPRGMFHSHGRHPVFHSGVDHETAHRLLPAMAEANFEAAEGPATPWVVSPSRAALPLRGGRVQFHELAPEAPERAAFDGQAVWRSIGYSFRETAEAAATISAARLELAAGGVAVTLTLPEGATLTSRTEEADGARVARVYSLVVNSRGETEAGCLVFAEVGGESFQRFEPCELITMARESDGPAGGRFLIPAPRFLAA
jgi:proteasome lid subunit RPN8/RPN11